MNKILAAVLLLAPTAAGAQNTHCFDDAISGITASGELIRLQSGQSFAVYPGQRVKSVFWEPLDKVRVCLKGGAAYQITGPKGVAVDALRQF